MNHVLFAFAKRSLVRTIYYLPIIYTFSLFCSFRIFLKFYAKPSYSRDEIFALINFNGEINYQFACRKCFTIAVTSCHSWQICVAFKMWQSYWCSATTGIWLKSGVKRVHSIWRLITAIIMIAMLEIRSVYNLTLLLVTFDLWFVTSKLQRL